MPDIALAHGAAVVGTGRSDFPNQINNVLVFPGLFKGALSCGTVQISGMKHAAAQALADLVPPGSSPPPAFFPPPQPGLAEAWPRVTEEARCTGRMPGTGKRNRRTRSFWFAGFVLYFLSPCLSLHHGLTQPHENGGHLGAGGAALGIRGVSVTR